MVRWADAGRPSNHEAPGQEFRSQKPRRVASSRLARTRRLLRRLSFPHFGRLGMKTKPVKWNTNLPSTKPSLRKVRMPQSGREAVARVVTTVVR